MFKFPLIICVGFELSEISIPPPYFDLFLVIVLFNKIGLLLVIISIAPPEVFDSLSKNRLIIFSYRLRCALI